MPDLFGVLSSVGCFPAQLPGFPAMQRELLAFGPGLVQTHELSWAGVGVISQHAHDPTVLMRAPGAPWTCAWIGDHRPLDDPKAASTFLDSLARGETRMVAGMEPPFAACLADDRARSAFLISDPSGLHPVYYACQDGALVFCTKLAPLLRSGVVKWNLDPRAVLDFFTFEHVTQNRTLADTVQVLPPGTILAFRKGRLSMRSYVQEPLNRNGSDSLRDAAHRLYEVLCGSVARCVPPSGRLDITLSGGLDSRALLGCALNAGAEVRTYTFGTPASRDVAYAGAVAAKCGVRHTFVQIDGSYLPRWLDHGVFVTGGMVNCIHYQILALADILAAEAEVVLDGLAGCPLTGGHLKWGIVLSNDRARAIEKEYRRRATAWASRAEREELLNPAFQAHADHDGKEAIRKYFDAAADSPAWKACHHFDLGERQRRFIQYGPHLLRSRLDVRTPFCSPPVVNLLSALPLGHLVEQRAYLMMLSSYLPTLATVPDSARGVPLSWPQTARFSKKAIDFVRRRWGLLRSSRASAIPAPTDYALWFRTHLRHFVEERLLDGNNTSGAIIRRQPVERLIRQHMDGSADHSVKLGCLLTFRTWLASMGIEHH